MKLGLAYLLLLVFNIGVKGQETIAITGIETLQSNTLNIESSTLNAELSPLNMKSNSLNNGFMDSSTAEGEELQSILETVIKTIEEAAEEPTEIHNEDFTDEYLGLNVELAETTTLNQDTENTPSIEQIEKELGSFELPTDFINPDEEVVDEDATDEEIKAKYEEYCKKYNKEYSENERCYKLDIFTQNYRTIAKHNRGNHTWRMGINMFTDMTAEERFEWSRTNAEVDDPPTNVSQELKELSGVRLGNYVTGQDAFVATFNISLRKRLEYILSIIRRLRWKIRWIRLKILRLREMIRRLRRAIYLIRLMIARLWRWIIRYLRIIRALIARLRALIERLRYYLRLLARCILHLRRCLRLLRLYLWILRRLFQLYWDRIIFILLTRNICQTKDWPKEVGIYVKNQGGCGSCWAFASTGAIEAAIGIEHRVSMDLSEQQFVDCGPGSCFGGWMASALNWGRNIGIHHSGTYPYVAANQTCQNPNGSKVHYSNVGTVPAKNTVAFLKQLCQTPITVAYLVKSDFFSYSSGVYDGAGCSGQTGVNHSVLAVGHDLVAPLPYVKFKNSWGTGWGESGFFKMKLQEKVSTDGTCNMTQFNANFVTGTSI